MNVKWPVSGLGASLTLNVSKFPDNFLMNVCIYSVALNGFQGAVEGFPGLLFA